jgi:DNA-directed RNA polymerase specialized sigma24 family protein
MHWADKLKECLRAWYYGPSWQRECARRQCWTLVYTIAYRFCRSMGLCDHQAQDVAMEATSQAMGVYESHCPACLDYPSAWFSKILRRKWIDALRCEVRQKLTTLPPEGEPQAPSAQPPPVWVWQVAFEMVIEHIFFLEGKAAQEKGAKHEVLRLAAQFYRKRLARADPRFLCVRDLSAAKDLIWSLPDWRGCWLSTGLPEERGELVDYIAQSSGIRQNTVHQTMKRLRKRCIRVSPWRERDE